MDFKEKIFKDFLIFYSNESNILLGYKEEEQELYVINLEKECCIYIDKLFVFNAVWQYGKAIYSFSEKLGIMEEFYNNCTEDMLFIGNINELNHDK